MFQQTITNCLETNEKIQNLGKKKVIKKEANCNYRIENHNNKKKFSGGAQHLIQSVDLRMDMRREKK